MLIFLCRFSTIVIIALMLLLSACITTATGSLNTAEYDVKLTSNPSGADVTITKVGNRSNNRQVDDIGYYIGQTPCTDTITMSAWQSYGGPYSITFLFEKPGYYDEEKTMTLTGSRTTTSLVHANLTPKPQSTTPADIGSVSHTITSDPSNAAVYFNEEYIGQTPLAKNIYWSNYSQRKEIRFEKSGYQTNRRMITASDKKIHVVLQP